MRPQEIRWRAIGTSALLVEKAPYRTKCSFETSDKVV
jgi:hypothetical protein